MRGAGEIELAGIAAEGGRDDGGQTNRLDRCLSGSSELVVQRPKQRRRAAEISKAMQQLVHMRRCARRAETVADEIRKHNSRRAARAIEDAHNSLPHLEKPSEEELDLIRNRNEPLAEKARNELREGLADVGRPKVGSP